MLQNNLERKKFFSRHPYISHLKVVGVKVLLLCISMPGFLLTDIE